MGLRHNFEASFDRILLPEYWDLRDAASLRFEELYNRAAPADFRPLDNASTSSVRRSVNMEC